MQIEYRAGNGPTGVAPQLQQLIGVSNKNALSLPSREITTAKISAVIITYNEEAIIGETLSRLWWCDEILVVDSHSTDRTVAICQEYNCRVISRDFPGFGEQKKFGAEQAKNDWILCLDADEVLSEELVDEIRLELSQTQIRPVAFAIPRTLVFMDKIFRHGKESGSPIIRLFNRTYGNWDGAVVHEKVEVKGEVKNLRNRILHYSYNDYGQFLNKINLYSTLGAGKMAARGKRKSRALVVAALPFNFFKYYILDRNFLNGYRGFTWSALNTVYHFIKYLKLEEVNKKAS